METQAVAAETKGSAGSSPPTKTGPWPPPPTTSKEPAKNNGELFTTKAGPPSPPGEPTSPDAHLIASVLIGVVLVALIVAVVAIFLWRRWRKASAPLPHWAGPSPFADGDVPDVGAEKGAAHGLKRLSVLSVLPWKVNKETELLGDAEGPRSGSQQKLDLELPPGSQEGESCPTTGNSDSSASMQTTISEEPGGMMDVPLHPADPEPPPPPPNWLGETHGDFCPSPGETLSLPSTADTHGLVALDPADQIPGETLPPPPEELLSD